jgi:tetratricopeptide (TPR) repeat protein
MRCASVRPLVPSSPRPLVPSSPSPALYVQMRGRGTKGGTRGETAPGVNGVAYDWRYGLAVGDLRGSGQVTTGEADGPVQRAPRTPTGDGSGKTEARMSYARTSLRREKRKLRESMRATGLDYRQIATEFARVYKLRPRAAWREAYGWSLQDAADKINDYRGSVGLDPSGISGMTSAHLCEHENWPGFGDAPSGRKPSPYLLAVLAGIYDCQVSDLIDLADRQHLPKADLLLIDTYARPSGPAASLTLDNSCVPVDHSPKNTESDDSETGLAWSPSSLLRIVMAHPAEFSDDQASLNSDAIDGLVLGPIPPFSDGIPVSVLVQQSTADAANLTMSAGREVIDPLAMEQLFDEVRRLSIAYNASTAGVDRQVLERATALRGNLQRMTAAYRDPSQSADLYLMIGLLSGICSYACLDLGYPQEAMAQARASFMMGGLAGHDGLRAWALGTRSLIARFEGRYSEALSYARQGVQYATSGTALLRLRCGEGQTLAHMGDAANAIGALNLAKDARGHVNSADVVDGLFTFSEAKQTYYSGSSLQWLSGEKNAAAAEAESVRAIRMFQQADPENRSLADELLAHVYLGNSRLTLGEIEGSMEALRPVLDLPVPERNSWQRKRMRQIATRLEKASFSDSRLAISSRDEISSFIEVPKQRG